jgi:Xaa-Pro aminopeptidase
MEEKPEFSIWPFQLRLHHHSHHAGRVQRSHFLVSKYAVQGFVALRGEIFRRASHSDGGTRRHRVARRVIRPGLREIDLWAEIHGAIQREVGERVPLGNDCVVGYRQNNIGGWPGDLLVRQDDSVIVDLSTVRHGYWSDSCATYYATQPSAAQAAAHRMIEEALAFAISLVRPGVMANEIDRKVRGFIEERGYPVYPHHTGHGVGVTGHEEPRIVPYNEVPLAAGMVILLEPGTYVPGAWGVRLEDALLVTEDGADVLTTHEKGMMG